MSYAPYPAYKASGVPWFDVVPEHWDVRRLKDVSRLKGGAGFPLDEQDVQGEELYFYKVGDLSLSKDGVHLDVSPHTISRTTAAKLRAEVIPKEAICYAKIGAALLLNRRRITTADCCIDNNMTALLPRTTELNYKYAFHWMSTVDFSEHTNPGAVPSLSEGYQSVLPIALPPIKEQTAIARFLDEKTSEIDDLIAKKEELLRLLAEQRIALITHAVTKGLTPNTPMKPSGTDWLGDVPEGWDVKPLKFLGRFQNGISIGGDSFGSGFPFVSYGDVYKNISLPETSSGLVESTAKDRVLYSVERGDIFFTRTSETIEEIAISSVCQTTIPDAVFAGFLIRCRPYPSRLNVGFSKYYFRNSRLRDYFVKEMNLVTRASLGQTLLGNLIVALPPLEEQEHISVFLDEKLEDLAKVEADAQKSIHLLKEYRTSIITSAVTGKIKVA
jgi:type I restriction enzyme S subunit